MGAGAIIELKNVTKVYQMGSEPVHALRGVSISIDSGEYVAIMGTSGSGKTTLMNIIGCLDRPDQGEYILAGQSVHSLLEDELAGVRNRQIGFIFQQFNLLPQMSALNNVMLPLTYAGVAKSERRERAETVLKLVGLGDRMHHNPNQLSGGQQQRVSIARALANKPKILLADEPTGALDSTTAAELMALIDDLVAQGTTMIVVTHDPETASHAKRLVKVKDGLVMADQVQNTQRERV
jgi:putative ABC transport system ATP-binding protein